MSEHADCAKAIRRDLKQAYPGTQFSVRSRTYSGGTSVDVEWLDGPERRDVSAVTCKYQYGCFNIEDDLYDISNSRDDLPQVRFVQLRREESSIDEEATSV